ARRPIDECVRDVRRVAHAEREIDVGPTILVAHGRGPGDRATGDTRIRTRGREEVGADALAVFGREHQRNLAAVRAHAGATIRPGSPRGSVPVRSSGPKGRACSRPRTGCAGYWLLLLDIV